MANKEKQRAYSRENYRRHGRSEKWLAAQRNRQLVKSFGITSTEYEVMAGSQRNLCLLCGEPETAQHYRTGRVLKLAVDHDHETGRVRGLLCKKCNQLVGRVERIGLQRFSEYLESADDNFLSILKGQ